MKTYYNKDIMEWDSFPVHDIIWTDPPWGERMVKLFYTMMNKKGYNPPKHTFIEIITKLGELADKSKPLVVEFSTKGYKEAILILERQGHSLTSIEERMQSMNRGYVILVFNKTLEIPKSKGFQLITDFFKRSDYKIVFDPFGGVGQTCRAVKKAGKIYIGSEMSPDRYEKLKKASI